MCVVTHSHVRHDSFTRVTWLIQTSHSCVHNKYTIMWHDTLIHTCHLIHMWHVTHMHMCHSHSYMSHSFICVTLYVWFHMCYFTCVTSYVWLHTCDFICVISYVWFHMCDFICVISYVWFHTCFTVAGVWLTRMSHVWDIQMCDMTHSFVWHDSFICVWLTRMSHVWINHVTHRMSHGPQYLSGNHIWLAYAWHDSFIRVTWLAGDSPHAQVTHS